MLRPSYTELMNVLNKQQNVDNKITSRYTIVIAAAKRARQLIDGSEPLVPNVPKDKAVSIAVSEMTAGEIEINSVNTDTIMSKADILASSVEVEGLGILS